MNKYYVYILASKRNGTLYIGFTNDLQRRVLEHKEKVIKGFTAKHNVTNLVCFQEFETAEEGLIRERQMKKWKRDWKLRLIEEENPQWKDLSLDWYE